MQPHSTPVKQYQSAGVKKDLSQPGLLLIIVKIPEFNEYIAWFSMVALSVYPPPPHFSHLFESKMIKESPVRLLLLCLSCAPWWSYAMPSSTSSPVFWPLIVNLPNNKKESKTKASFLFQCAIPSLLHQAWFIHCSLSRRFVDPLIMSVCFQSVPVLISMVI